MRCRTVHAAFTALVVIVATVALVGCGGATPRAAADGAGEEYTVRLHRPLVAGQRISVSVDVAQEVEVLVGGEARIVDGFTLDVHVALEAVVSVEGAADDGHVARARVEIARCVNPDTGAVIFEPGSVITVDGYGTSEVALSLAGGAISDAQLGALMLAFPFRRPGSPTGQAMFGPTGPVRIGDRWDLDRQHLARGLEVDGYFTEQANLDGTATLTALEDCQGARCLVLESHFTAQGASYEGAGNASMLTEGRVAGDVRVRAPLDPEEFLRSEEAVVTGTFTVHVETPDGDIDRDVRVRRTRTATYAPAPPAPSA